MAPPPPDPGGPFKPALAARFDSVYDAWVFFDKVGDWKVSADAFEEQAKLLQLDKDGVTVAEVLAVADPRGTRILDPQEFCSVMDWQRPPGDPESRSLTRLAAALKLAHGGRKGIVALALARSKDRQCKAGAGAGAGPISPLSPKSRRRGLDGGAASSPSVPAGRGTSKNHKTSAQRKTGAPTGGGPGTGPAPVSPASPSTLAAAATG